MIPIDPVRISWILIRFEILTDIHVRKLKQTGRETGLWVCKLANFNETSFENKVANWSVGCGFSDCCWGVRMFLAVWFDHFELTNHLSTELFVQKLTPLLFPFSTHRTYIRQNSNCWNEILIQVQLTQLPPIKSTNLTTDSCYLPKKLQIVETISNFYYTNCLSLWFR